jgi:hypothetical protein
VVSTNFGLKYNSHSNLGGLGGGTAFAITGITQSNAYEDGYGELDESVSVWMRGFFVYLL